MMNIMLTQGLCNKCLFGLSILGQRVVGRTLATGLRFLLHFSLLWFHAFLCLVATHLLALLGLGVRLLLVGTSTLLSYHEGNLRTLTTITRFIEYE